MIASDLHGVTVDAASTVKICTVPSNSETYTYTTSASGDPIGSHVLVAGSYLHTWAT